MITILIKKNLKVCRHKSRRFRFYVRQVLEFQLHWGDVVPGIRLIIIMVMIMVVMITIVMMMMTM